MTEHLKELTTRAENAEAERDELERIFVQQRKRDAGWVEQWRRDHPGNDLVKPDYGTMLDYLHGKLIELTGSVKLIESERDLIRDSETERVSTQRVADAHDWEWWERWRAAHPGHALHYKTVRGEVMSYLIAAADEAEAERDRLRKELGECWDGVQADIMVESQTRAVLEAALLEPTT